MDPNTITYIVWSGIALLVAGCVAFPRNLSYDNTWWMPRWMRPGVDYLERGHDFNYPADEARAYFSIILMFTGVGCLSGYFLLYSDSPVPAADWAANWLTLLFPTYMLLHTLALRSLKSPGEASYNNAVTRYTIRKVETVLLAPGVLMIAYMAGLPFTVFRVCSVAYTVATALFLAYDFRIVYRARWSDCYLTNRFSFLQMCPESNYLLYFIAGTAILQPYLWTGDYRLPLAFGVLTVVFLLFEYVLRFHLSKNYDEFLHNYDYVENRRRRLWTYEAEKLCRLARRGWGIFRNDGRKWTVIVTQHKDFEGFLYVCTSEYGEQLFRLDLIGEREVFCREFATLREAFEYRLHLMRLYEEAYYKASSRAERIFEKALSREDFAEGEKCLKKACI